MATTSRSKGATFATNRGAEQGDVLGTIQIALVLGQARAAHLGEFLSKPLGTRTSAMNGSSMTGRCSFVPFSLIPSCALDGGFATFWCHPGVRRARQRQELRAPPLPAGAPDGVSEMGHAVHDTIDVLTLESGSAFGSREHINAQTWESVRACDEMRSAIGSVDRAPRRWSSPGSARTCPSSCTTCASTVVNIHMFINFFHMGAIFCFFPAILIASTYTDRNNPCFR